VPAAEGKDVYYRLLPGVEVRKAEGGEVHLRSESVALTLDGAAAGLFTDRILPLLDGRRSLCELAESLSGADVRSLRTFLDELAEAGVLRRATTPRDAVGDPLLDLLASAGRDPDEDRRLLAKARVAIFGLEGHGALLAGLLVRAGVGTLVLVDPHPLREGDIARGLLPPVSSVGRAREDVLREHLQGQAPRATLRGTDAAQVDEESVRKVAEEADLLVGTFHHELMVVNRWVNRAALSVGRPALFGELLAHRAVAGPLVLPGRSACYECWRMRHLACAANFTKALALERTLDQRREPSIATPAAWPPLAWELAGMLASEVLRCVLELGTPGLAGRVVVHDLLASTTETHRILERPDCPACGGQAPQAAPSTRSVDGPVSEVDFDGALARAGAEGGWIRRLDRIPKDPSEPERPFLFRAQLANHGFLSSGGRAFLECFGKGMTLEEARRRTVGEAAERYCASLRGTSGVVRVPRRELDGPSLDPRRLVLFAPEQYERLPYEPYDDDRPVAWLEGRSLSSREPLWVPALAVLLAFRRSEDEAYLFPPSSNGLAAGPSLEAAILAGLCEVLERDAFLLTWLHRLPALRVDPETHPLREVVDLARAYARRGVSMELYALPTDHPVHVFMGLAVEPRADPGPAVAVGLGADLDPARAARSALLEAAQVRPTLRVQLRDPDIRARVRELVEDPHRVADVDDHQLLYSHASMLERFSFLRDVAPQVFDWSYVSEVDREDVGACLELMADHLCERNCDPVFSDLSTADLRRFGLFVARVVVPELQPIHFGRGERRLGGTRLRAFPRLLEGRSDDVDPSELNDDPHPLA